MQKYALTMQLAPYWNIATMASHLFLGTHAPGCHAGGARDVLERVPSRPCRHQRSRDQAEMVSAGPPQRPSARSQRSPESLAITNLLKLSSTDCIEDLSS